MVAAGVEVDLRIDGPAHEVTVMAAYHVVFLAFFLETEFEDKAVLASKALEIASVELSWLVKPIDWGLGGTDLRQDDDNRSTSSDIHNKFGAMIVGRPGDVQGSPLLSDCPVGPKKTGPIEVLVLLKQVIV